MGALEQAARLLDFNEKIDINLLDNVVEVMNKSTGQQQTNASAVLTQLKDHPDSWTRVDAILEYSTNINTKYFALQILEKVIQTRWKALPRVQCDGIKQYVVGLVIKISSDENLTQEQKTYLGKLNLVLVQIVKQEWPKNWPSFIQDIVGASKHNESLCMNNMKVLKLLSEEVFDFSADQMTQAKAHHLKQQFCGEFQAVFQLCQFVLDNSQNVPLIEATLETLLKFLNWIPIGYLFETNLVDNLTSKFLNVPVFRNVALKCLTEISAVSLPESSQTLYKEKLILLFLNTLAQLKELIPQELNLHDVYNMGSDGEQKFIANLAMFFCAYLKEHAALVEVTSEVNKGLPTAQTEHLGKAHQMAMHYLLKISEVDDVEIFKICLEYWNSLCSELYRECPFLCATTPSMFPPFGGFSDDRQTPPRRKLYTPHLSKLRYIMIGRMTKPEEVLIVENEQGEVVRETIKDTDSINLYKTMRETLVYLTHLDYIDTERIMTEKLQNQLCWAVGSISGAMMEEDEKRFLVTVIRDLLGLCEQKRGKDNKAVIASNIMYVVGQYPRFLRAHWKFLKTVVNKLFEFMHETHEGVQDMACDTFIKISQKCKRHFVISQVGETQPFIDELLLNINSIICDLSPPQVHVFYEAVGCIISSQLEASVRDNLIERLMQLPNSVWDEIILHASQNVEVLKEPEAVKNLLNILKTNVAACKSVGNPFLCQLSKIYLDMLNVYKCVSENISSAVGTHGQSVLKQPLIKTMRGVKTETLKLIAIWVSKSEDVNLVLGNFVPPLFEAVLFDYQRNVAAAREPEVLSCITAIINRLESSMSAEVPKVFDAVFQCTLEMINKDFEEFPEHRTNFFLLLQAVNEHCFNSFLQIPPPQFKLIMDSIIWAFKHTMRNVAETGLEILLRLLMNVSGIDDQTAMNGFFSVYFTELLEHVLSVVTDSSQAQVAGLTYYADILGLMFQLVEKGKVAIPLNAQNQAQSNIDYIFEFVGRLLKQAFPHLTDDQIRVTVKGFYSYDDDTNKLKEHLRDFLVQIKQDLGQDTADLFLEERESEIQKVQAAKDAIPGIRNPHAGGGVDVVDTGARQLAAFSNNATVAYS